MSSLPLPAHMPCPDCGASVARGREAEHTCDEERLLRYRMFQLRGELAGFDDAFRAYLDSPAGRFEAWYAARQRSRRRRA